MKTELQKQHNRQYYREHRAENLEKFRLYDAAHITEIKVRKAAYRETNRDEINSKSKAEYHAHRAARLAQKRVAYAADTKKFAERVKKYRLANPGKIEARNLRRKLRERMAAQSVDLVRSFYHSVRCRPWVKCYWCGCRIRGKDAHIDHVIALSKGGNHAIENFAVSCGPCNLSKGPKLPHEWPKHPQMFFTL